MKWARKEAAIRALERNGKVDPNDLIGAARSLEHPCHEDFTWDVEKAANERWRDQARALIRRCDFEVVVEEVTQRAVRYVPAVEGNLFVSLPKTRAVATVSTVLTAEVAALHGVASRVHGIALAKQGIVGDGVVAKLKTICETLAEMKAELAQEKPARRSKQPLLDAAG